MLQIVSGKFFKGDRTFDTLHKGTFYTNYRLADEAPIDTDSGRLLSSAELDGLGTLTYELTERIEWQEIRSGVMTSTGGRELKEEFADVVSFALNIICTTDQDVCRRLILPNADAFDARSASTKFLPRVFNAAVVAEPGDAEKLTFLVRQLIGLPRKTYETAIKAIRQYVAALQSVGSDATLAYSLLITSVESLSQAAVVPDATWDDFDQRKRTPIDDALEDAPPELAEAVRNAILESEHVAIARRFREFIKSHIAPEFYRAEAASAVQAINRQDLDHLLRDAYSIRSSYVHRLQSLTHLVANPFGHQEMFYLEDQPTLAFAGLARLSRHVILQFIARSEVVDREDFDWHSALPNIVRMRLSPEYWMGKSEGYTTTTAGVWLEALLVQISEAILSPGKPVTDLTPILDKIDGMPIGSFKKNDRRSIITLYYLFICYAGVKYERPNRSAFVTKYDSELQEPCAESLALYLFTNQEFPWNLTVLEALHSAYFQKRRNKTSLRLGGLLESIFTLRVAELYRSAGDSAKAREYISFAVEASPGNKALLDLEARSATGELQLIDPLNILIPNRTTA